MSDLTWGSQSDWEAASKSDVTVENDTFQLASAIPDSPLTQDLVAWYRFEDGDARDYASSAEFPSVTWGDSTAFDGTVNGATFQSSGGVTDFENGANSGVFDFDGGNDSITTTVAQPSLPLTFTAWIKTSATGYLDIVGIGQGTSTGDQIGLTCFDGNLKIFFYSDDVGSGFSSNINNGVFNHVAGSISSGNFQQAYVNGSKIGDNQGSSSYTGDGSFGIGRHRSDRSDFFNGLIDDVRYYNRALTESEISSIYNATKP